VWSGAVWLQQKVPELAIRRFMQINGYNKDTVIMTHH